MTAFKIRKQKFVSTALQMYYLEGAQKPASAWKPVTQVYMFLGSVPVDFLRPKFRVAHTKHDVISILMNE